MTRPRFFLRHRCVQVLATGALLLLVSVSSGWAQTRSTVTGTVTDATGAVLPGATVVLQSPDVVGGAQTSVTNEKGVYRFSDLPPGTYQVTASLQGFQTLERTGLRLPFATTITVDFALAVGGVELAVTVEGKTPQVDVTTAMVTAKVDKDLLMSLPMFSNLQESNMVFELSPGSTYGAALGGATGGSTIKIDGQDMFMNAVVISTAWLEEVNVVGLGASAEYGEFGGVTANYVVRSGSNAFHGLVDYRTTRPTWMASNISGLSAVIQTRLTSPQLFSRWDTDAQVGGPVAKDKLFFFGGVQYFRNKTQQANTVAPADTKWPRYVGKVNWAVAKTVKAEAMYTYNKSEVTSWGVNYLIDAGSTTTQPGHTWNSRVTWTPNTKSLVEVRTGGATWIQDIHPVGPGTEAGPPPRRDSITGKYYGNSPLIRKIDNARYSFGATLTHYVDSLAGRHAFKLGTDYENIAYSTKQGYAGGMSFVDRNGVPDQVTIWDGDFVKGVGTRTVFFAQDDWNVTNRLTLQPGLRFTLYRGSTPTAGKIVSVNPLSPRLGLAWEVGKGHKTVVRAQWGRFHAMMDSAVWEFTDTATRTPTITARVNADGSFTELTRTTPAQNSAIDPNLKWPYMDQFFVGVERELFAEVSVKVQYIHKSFTDNYAYIDTGSVYAPVQARDPGPDNVLGNADDGEMLTVYALTNPGKAFYVQTNPDGADRKYDAFQVIAQKRFSNNWQFLASYTRSESRGLLNNSNLGSYIGTGGVWANPNTAINAGGRSGLDFPHQASLRATYHSTLFGGFNVAGSLIYASGVAWSRTATIRGLPQGNVTVRVAPRGSEDAASTKQLDLRVEKLVPLGSPNRAVGVFFDVFNVFNAGFPPQTRYNEASGATFGQPQSWVEGRSLKVGFHLTF